MGLSCTILEECTSSEFISGSIAPYRCGSGMRYGRASAEPPMGKGCKRNSPFNYEGITLGGESQITLRHV